MLVFKLEAVCFPREVRAEAEYKELHNLETVLPSRKAENKEKLQDFFMNNSKRQYM
jgi:hypothetical protein